MHKSPRDARRLLCVVSVVVAGLLGACTRDYQLDLPPEATEAIAAQGPLDILFVVDNSASMSDEHQALVRSVFDERCPIDDVTAVPQRFANPPPEVLAELAEVCGLAQLLAAIGGDYHIGVITTDVGICDERVSAAQDPDDVHTPTPMRGCLQGGLLGSAADIRAGFENAIIGVGTWGSPRERGLDAMEIFLDPDARRAPGCENDLDGFLRKDGRLLVVFVADEDDCSHQDGAFGFSDELVGEPQQCGDFFDLFSVANSAARCSDDAELLAPVSRYAGFLRGLVSQGRTQDVYVGVVGGLFENAGLFVPGGCSPDDGGVTAVCTPSFGTAASCSEEERCCAADGAFRYAELAAAVNSEALLGSICASDFRAPLLPIFFNSNLDDVSATNQ